MYKFSKYNSKTKVSNNNFTIVSVVDGLESLNYEM